jgi:hypothetical protein
VENGAIPVQGRTTNATTVTIRAAYLGPIAEPVVRPSPSPSGSGSGSASSSPSTAPATPRPPTPPPVQTLPVGSDGSFNTGVELTAGRWSLTVTASSAQSKTTTLTRTVNVQFSGVNLVVTVGPRPVWLKVWVDGHLDGSTGQGKVFLAGRTLTFMADSSIEVRTADSGATSYTLNGTPLGPLGKDGAAETWLFAPPNAAEQTDRQ